MSLICIKTGEVSLIKGQKRNKGRDGLEICERTERLAENCRGTEKIRLERLGMDNEI